MLVPDELRYSADHQWVMVDSEVPNRLRVGITDYAQDALGDVVYLEAPTVGTRFDAGQSFGEVESTKSVSDVFAPVTGTVVEVNDALGSNPELINEDPYGDGWIVVLEAEDVSTVGGLLDASAYIELTTG